MNSGARQWLKKRPTWSRRVGWWVALVALMGVVQGLLVALTLSYESSRLQEQTDAAGNYLAGEIRRSVLRIAQELQTLTWTADDPGLWAVRGRELMTSHLEIAQLEWRDASFEVVRQQDRPEGPGLFSRFSRRDALPEVRAACDVAARSGGPAFSRSYFVPGDAHLAGEVMDLCLSTPARTGTVHFVVATFRLSALLEANLVAPWSTRYAISFVEADGARLARAGAGRGVGLFVANQLVDLPGRSMQLRVDSVEGRPSLIPNVMLALVLLLSLLLTAVIGILVRDARRRALAEDALAEALAFRKAMEDSLSTGLRARDLQGHITYVNPAFCAMLGYAPEQLLGQAVPPYWPPEKVEEYKARQAQRLSASPTPVRIGRGEEGFETLFMRANGERIPVMIYETPLVDGAGKHRGWMSAVLDVSEQRRNDELARQQQDRLQATARLATVGEMASLLSHELNQPLSAIASYASGSLNLMEEPDPPLDMIQGALRTIADQAERAGRVIKSVHDFVRRREQFHENLAADVLVEAVLPLMRLQARKSGTRIEMDLPQPVPRVHCDRTMLEQVLLNLARNAIQAMETQPLERRVLTLRVRQTLPKWVRWEVQDQGDGIEPEVAERLFTPFFSTKAEGMGLGLSMCRTVVEQHGGHLEFQPTAGTGGTTFVFTLPAAGS